MLVMKCLFYVTVVVGSLPVSSKPCFPNCVGFICVGTYTSSAQVLLVAVKMQVSSSALLTFRVVFFYVVDKKGCDYVSRLLPSFEKHDMIYHAVKDRIVVYIICSIYIKLKELKH